MRKPPPPSSARCVLACERALLAHSTSLPWSACPSSSVLPASSLSSCCRCSCRRRRGCRRCLRRHRAQHWRAAASGIGADVLTRASCGSVLSKGSAKAHPPLRKTGSELSGKAKSQKSDASAGSSHTSEDDQVRSGLARAA
eukprot:1802547-Rhodomonas_salina.2